MKREWKPGDIALVDYGTGCEVMLREHSGWFSHCTEISDLCDDVESVRPLVVIDPECEADVDRLANAIRNAHRRDSGVWTGLDWLSTQAALREFADPKPPKPEEPTGLGAVVEDVDGIRWLRVCEHTNGCNSWRPFDRVLSDIDKSADARKHWPEVSAVRVLSEGVIA